MHSVLQTIQKGLMFVCSTEAAAEVKDSMAILLGMTDMVYDPLLIWKPVTATDTLFCTGYAVLCQMPLVLELWADYRFSTAKSV